LQPIDLTLFLGAVRNKSTLPADIREISILRVVALCESQYEINGHLPYAERASVSDESLKAFLQDSKTGLSEGQWAATQCAEAMTSHMKLPKEIFETLKEWLDDQWIAHGNYGCAKLCH
jgi:4-carboxymuconolactone decarboxylase